MNMQSGERASTVKNPALVLPLFLYRLSSMCARGYLTLSDDEVLSILLASRWVVGRRSTEEWQLLRLCVCLSFSFSVVLDETRDTV